MAGVFPRAPAPVQDVADGAVRRPDEREDPDRVDDPATTTGPRLPAGAARTGAARRSAAPQPVGRAQPVQRAQPAQPVLARLCEVAVELLRAGASQVSVLTDVQTITAAAGLAAPAVGERTPLAEALCTTAVVECGPVVVADAGADPRVRDLPAVTSGAIGAYLAAPLHGEDGHVVGVLCVFDPVPREWTPADLAALTQLAAVASAVLTASAPSREDDLHRALADLSVDAAGIGTYVLRLPGRELVVDDRVLALHDLDREHFSGRAEDVYARIHPDEVDGVVAAVEHAVATGGTYSAEYRAGASGGRHRWVAARGRTLLGDDGRTTALVGALYDVTALREATTRVTRVLESMAVGYLSVDAGWRVTYANAEAEHALGRPRGELVGGVLWDLFPAAVGTEFEAGYRRAAGTGEPVTFDAYYPAPLDAWYEVRATPEADGLAVYFVDITERRRAQERAELLARVTEELAGTLDAEEAVARLAQLVVPTLAEWCVVSLVADDQRSGVRRGLRDVGAAHADPAKLPLAEAYAQTRLDALRDGSFLGQALSTGRPVVLAERAAERISGVLRPGTARDLLGQLAPDSFVVLPLLGRGRTVGLLSLFNSASRSPITPEELAAASDIAGRAGLALDNTRLYRQQRQLAEGLQRSLLTAPAEPDHAQVVVRYTPAAEAAQVGGDWYDSFLQAEGATVVAIGDVLGHDTEAAAAMGQVRSMLRGIAVVTGAGPADVLRGVDRAMVALQMGTTATAVVLRLEQTEDGAPRGTTRARWSNAGHPPPLAISPDGTVAPLVTTHSELLLGLDPGTERTETEAVLEAGATLLLYTDGLVERRAQSLERGLAQLRATLEDLAARDLTLDELCDEVLARMLPEHPEDDVALIAVRLRPQERLRPAESPAS